MLMGPGKGAEKGASAPLRRVCAWHSSQGKPQPSLGIGLKPYEDDSGCGMLLVPVFLVLSNAK